MLFGPCSIALAEFPKGVLRFDRDNFIAGSLRPTAESNMIQWSNAAFVEAFEFPLKAISSASFPAAEPDAQSSGSFGVELTSGTRLFGTPVGMEGPWILLETPLFGRQRIETTAIRKLFRWSDGSACLFHGPGSLQDWEQFAPSAGELGRMIDVEQLQQLVADLEADAEGDASERDSRVEVDNAKVPILDWRDVGGQLEATDTAATIFRDVGLQTHSSIELEVAWEDSPNFVIALATDGTAASYRQAYRIEVWNGAIVLVRELEERATVRILAQVAELNGRLRITVDLNQQTGQVLIYSMAGETLVDQTMVSEEGSFATGIQLENIGGHLRVERLDVMRGGVAALEPENSNDTYIARNDGSQVHGEWINMDATNITMQIDGEIQEIPLEDVTLVTTPNSISGFGGSGSTADGEISTDSIDPSSNESAVLDLENVGRQFYSVAGGVRLAGIMQSVTQDAIEIKVAHVEKVLAVPHGALRGIFVPEEPEVKAGLIKGRSGVLEMEGTRIRGVLADAAANADHSGLRFAPRWATDAAHLKHSASGEIVYRDASSSSSRSAAVQNRQRNNLVNAMSQLFAAGARSGGSRLVHLRSGDAVPARVKSISSEGVLIDSVVTGERLIPHAEIKAAELVSMSKKISLDEAKRKRLLTIPRIKKKSPPKNLLISVDGDFLRGDLVSMDEKVTVVQSRLEEIEVPTSLIAKVIWFHEDEIKDDSVIPSDSEMETTETPAAEAPERLLLQAVQRDGIRLTFYPSEAGGGEIVGESELIGVCLVDIKTVDRLIFGDAVNEAREELLFYDWRLTHALLPAAFAQAEDNGSTNAMAGTQSPLVGQPAPDFNLSGLDGTPIAVSSYWGSVLVLDFWASWCGPCMQAMPQIERAVEQFPADQVQLVAVNLQESTDQISRTLERLGIEPTVAMDIDGVAAARYQANAIPQTVVIGRDGTIERLFVGGGPQLEAELVAAIRTALQSKNEATSETE